MVEALQMSAGWDMPVYGHRDYNDAMPNTTTVCPGQNLYDIIDRVY